VARSRNAIAPLDPGVIDSYLLQVLIKFPDYPEQGLNYNRPSGLKRENSIIGLFLNLKNALKAPGIGEILQRLSRFSWSG
jgi:hypothetical protein